jgi:hypothetical protein
MASNKILSSQNIATIYKGGKQIVLAAATETSLWKRTADAVAVNTPGFTQAVDQSPAELPKGTAKVIMRSV